jgi:hypothetical protein
MRSSIRLAKTFQPGASRRLFVVLLCVLAEGAASVSPFTVVTDWLAGLDR